MQVFDQMGRFVRSVEIIGSPSLVGIEDLRTGIYLLRFFEQEKLLNTTKLIVTK